MHPYLIILSLPLIGIIVFWLLPLPIALLAYLVVLLVSALMYWIVARTMKRRAAYGVEALIGAEARVVSKLGTHAEAQYMVKVHGELWRANSRDDLKPDDTVKISSVDGLTLGVGKYAGHQPQARNE